MAILLDNIVRAQGAKLAWEFARQCRDPRKTQEALLARIMKENAATAFGQEHGFKGVKTLEEYRRRVPVTKYEMLEPYIERMRHGEPNQLTADAPVFFATTSGTTGRPKYIPVTAKARTAKAAMMRLWLYYALRDHPGMFDGKILSVVSPEEEERSPSGLPCGAESGHAYRNIPSVVRSHYCVPYEVFTVEDYEARYYTILRLAIDGPVSLIGTCNPSTIVLLGQKLDTYKSRLLHDLKEGILDASMPLPPPVRDELHGMLKPQPARAAELERRIEEAGGRLTPAVAWPDLKLVGCWKGGSSALHLKEFETLFRPGQPVRDWGWLASEVRGSVPMSDTVDGGPLTVGLNVFEFVAEEDVDSETPNFLGAHELEAGKKYFVYVTTLSGLYRYDMNDMLEVAEFYKGTPVVKFVQKGQGVTSLTGEKLYEAQVVEAAQRAGEGSGLDYELVAATVQWDQKPRYVFLVEFATQPAREALIGLGGAIERALRDLNVEYASKRKSLRLDTPLLKIVAPGELERYRREKMAAGGKDGQFKMVRLVSDFEFQKQFKVVDEIEVLV